MWNKPIKTFSLVASSFCLGVAGTLLLHEKKGQNSVEKITNQHLLHTENSFSPNQSTQNSHSTLSKTKRFQTLISELESNSHSTSRSCLKNPWNETLIHAVQKAAPSLVHILSEKLKPSVISFIYFFLDKTLQPGFMPSHLHPFSSFDCRGKLNAQVGLDSSSIQRD
eukprot:Sdes_comp16134_c0_seq1m5375